MEIDPHRAHVAGPLATLYYDRAADPMQLTGDASPRRRLFGDDSSSGAHTHPSPARSLLSAFQQASSASAGSSTAGITSPNRTPASHLTSSNGDIGIAQLQAPSRIASPQRPIRIDSASRPSSASRNAHASRFDSPAFRALNGASSTLLPTSPARSESAPFIAAAPVRATPVAVKRDEPSWQVFRDPQPDEAEPAVITRLSAHDILDIEADTWDVADVLGEHFEQENVRPATVIRTTPPTSQSHARRGSLLARPAQSEGATDSNISSMNGHFTPPSFRRDHTRDVTPPATNPLLPYLEPGSALANSVRVRHETDSPPSREVKRRRRHGSASPDGSST